MLAGAGAAHVDGYPLRLEANSALHLRPGTALAFDNLGPELLTLASALCPDPGIRPVFEPACAISGPTRPSHESALPRAGAGLARLGDRASEPAPDGRSFEVLLNEASTGAPVTLFVGSIPTGRAPDHSHGYEEALIVLEGRGRAWLEGAGTPVGPGSCVFLPEGQVHCMENLGDGPLRLLGIFYPSGSPAGSTRLVAR